MSTTTLEHLSEPFSFFSQVERILKPGGKIFLYVPFAIGEHQIPYDFFRYTSYGLRYLCKKSGLKVISIVPSNSALHTSSRWAYIALGGIKSEKISVKFLKNFLLGVVKLFLIPLYDSLATYSTVSLPMCWCLVAEKEGTAEKESKPVYASKQQIIDSIIWCPSCKNKLNRSENAHICSMCLKEYQVKNNQIAFL